MYFSTSPVLIATKSNLCVARNVLELCWKAAGSLLVEKFVAPAPPAAFGRGVSTCGVSETPVDAE